MEEFFQQGDLEQERGLDFSPLCDRQNTMVPQGQIGAHNFVRHIVYLLVAGFIDFIVSPTLSVCGEVLALVVPGRREQEKPWHTNLAANKERWQAKVGLLSL